MGQLPIDDLVVFNYFKGSVYQLPQRLKLLDCFPYVIESRAHMKFTSHVTVITRDYDCYMLYGKGTEPNQRRLDLHIISVGVMCWSNY